MLRFSTAGESHGESLVALLSGLPAGVPIDTDFVNRELWRRQQGYGRGGRMRIETDTAHFLSGVRHGKTIGSPIAIEIENRDWKNWTEALPVERGRSRQAQSRSLAASRPCRSGRRAQIRLSRCAVRAGACLGARIHRPRRGRSGREATAARAGHRRGEPRHPRGRGRVGAHSHVGRNQGAARRRRNPAQLRRSRRRTSHEGRRRRRPAHRRYRWRRLRSRGARRASGPRAPAPTGTSASMACWPRP